MSKAWDRLKAGFLALLEIVLPEPTRSKRTRSRTLGDFSLAPTTHSLLNEEITTLLDYKEQSSSDLVRALKYEHSSKAADLAAEILADYLREELSSIRSFSSKPVILVPMPLHSSRKRSRGFNQMEKVLARLPREFQAGTLSRVSLTALVRHKPTQQQTKLSRSERLHNMANAFTASDTEVQGSHIILIDDVTTTGATLLSAANELRSAGATVSLLALARA